MLVRSYVTPVHRLTGDFITSMVIGHLKKLGTVNCNGLDFSLAIVFVNVCVCF